MSFAFGRLSARDMQKMHAADFQVIITGSSNIAEPMLDMTRENGLLVWVEVSCFQGEELWQRFPQSRPTVDGKQISKTGPPGNKWYAGVLPNPKVVADRLLFIEKLLDRYKVPVLYLDFCRFPGRWEDGLGQAISAENGETRAGKRMKIITDFVRQVAKLCRARGTKLGIFLVPYDNSEYGQDLGEVAQICDYFSPMLYHKICGRKTEWIGDRCNFFSKKLNRKIIPVLQSLPEPTPLPPVEFRQALNQVDKKLSQGVMILSWESLTPEMKVAVRKI